MKYYLTINQQFAREHGLNSSEAIIFAWLYELPSWADKIEYSGNTYYFASRKKACDELPIISDKPDTFYRLYKKLQDKGLIVLVRIDGKEFIALTEAGKKWYYADNKERETEADMAKKNPNCGNISENSVEINPQLGKISETDSENFPTYNIYKNIDNIYNKADENNFSSCATKKSKDRCKLFRTFFDIDSGNVDELNNVFSGSEYANIDLFYYYFAVADWSDSANRKRTRRGWLATIRNFIKLDKEQGKLHTLTDNNSRFNINEISEYINHEY